MKMFKGQEKQTWTITILHYQWPVNFQVSEFLRWNPQPSAEYRAFSWTLTYMPAKNYQTPLTFVMLIRQTGCRGFFTDFPRPSAAALHLLYPPTCFWCTDFHGVILSQRKNKADVNSKVRCTIYRRMLGASCQLGVFGHRGHMEVKSGSSHI